MSKSTKVSAIALASIVSVSSLAGGVSNINAAEVPTPIDTTILTTPMGEVVDELQATPRLSWINLGTITLDPVYINTASKIQAAFTKAFISLLGYCLPSPITSTVVTAINSQIKAGNYNFYVKLTQYSSTDYNWRKFDYKIYADKACTKYIGSGAHAPWQLRMLSEQLYMENLVEELQSNDVSEEELKALFVEGVS